ncbi:MAG TPA: SDR family oxidoreductase [Lacisediminihabitans sp.]|uniref:SDR family NAD(P)-dependent oxidoreductase n=1 Tax=Lacisediminihabitans sp. TaxID=2787631 RepID=UPI002EDA44BE
MDNPTRTAVITGASSGFGAEFARRFADDGYALVLIARRHDRLVALADELSARHGTTSVVIAADLTDPTAPSSIAEELQARGILVDALVNSAGFGTAGPFAVDDPTRIADEIQVNVAALTLLTRLLLPGLIDAPAGILVNVSSTAAHQPLPNAAVYGATKAYVTSFTEAVWQETRGTAVRVLGLCPGPTETEFFAVAGSDRFKVGQMLSVARVVDIAFRALGHGGSGPTVIAGWRNRVTALAARLVPRRLTLAVGDRLMGGPR